MFKNSLAKYIRELTQKCYFSNLMKNLFDGKSEA